MMVLLMAARMLEQQVLPPPPPPPGGPPWSICPRLLFNQVQLSAILASVGFGFLQSTNVHIGGVSGCVDFPIAAMLMKMHLLHLRGHNVSRTMCFSVFVLEIL